MNDPAHTPADWARAIRCVTRQPDADVLLPMLGLDGEIPHRTLDPVQQPGKIADSWGGGFE